MAKFDFDLRIGPSTIFGALNFLVLAFTAGTIYNGLSVKGDKAASDLVEIQHEVKLLREQHTSIAVLQTDVNYIKTAMQRLETFMIRQRQGEVGIPSSPPR